jgi:hypothetical protein
MFLMQILCLKNMPVFYIMYLDLMQLIVLEKDVKFCFML